MPIDDLTTNPEPAYPRLGYLRKGSPKKRVYSKRLKREVWVVGDDLDHFRFVCDKPEVVARFKEVYGDTPREINVYLPFATKDENLDAWMKEYGAGGLKVKCTRPKDREDGIILWQDDTGMFRDNPKVCQWPNCECKPTGVLTVIIPELVPVGGVKAVWVTTKSWNDCAELARNLAAAERDSGGNLRGIPFVLSRRLDSVPCPPREGSNGKRVRDDKWMLHLEPHPEWVAEQLEANRRLASPLKRLAAPQPSPFDEAFADDYEDEDIERPETEIIDDEPEPETNGNGDEEAKAVFFNHVLDKIPFYTSIEQIGEVLKSYKCTHYAKSREDWMWDKLQEHAKNKADEEAAAEEVAY